MCASALIVIAALAFNAGTPQQSLLHRRRAGTAGVDDPTVFCTTGGHYWQADLDFTEVTGVSQWDDQIGAFDLVQPTGAAQPTHNTGGQNGQDYMRGDGSDDDLHITGQTDIIQPFLVCASFQYVATGDNATMWGDAGAQDLRFLMSTAGGSDMRINAGTNVTGTTDVGTTFHSACVWYNGTACNSWIDGTADIVGQDCGTNALDPFYIFSLSGGGNGNVDFYDVLICEEDDHVEYDTFSDDRYGT